MPISFSKLKSLLMTSEKSPHVTAMSLAVGIALAFSPFVGLHLLAVIIISRWAKLNGLIMLAGTLVHNPWTMFPIHGLGLVTGDLILHGHVASVQLADHLQWRSLGFSTLIDPAFWRENHLFIRQLILPFTIGSLFWSAMLGSTTYLGVRRFLRSRQSHQTCVSPS